MPVVVDLLTFEFNSLVQRGMRVSIAPNDILNFLNGDEILEFGKYKDPDIQEKKTVKKVSKAQIRDLLSSLGVKVDTFTIVAKMVLQNSTIGYKTTLTNLVVFPGEDFYIKLGCYNGEVYGVAIKYEQKALGIWTNYKEYIENFTGLTPMKPLPEFFDATVGISGLYLNNTLVGVRLFLANGNYRYTVDSELTEDWIKSRLSGSIELRQGEYFKKLFISAEEARTFRITSSLSNEDAKALLLKISSKGRVIH